MNVEVTVSIDKRRKSKKTGKYPVKLRLYTSEPKREKYYPLTINNLKLYLSEKEFETIYDNRNVKGNWAEIKRATDAHKEKAREIISSLDPFTFEEFEKSYSGRSRLRHDVFSLFAEVVAAKEKAGAISTAEKYQTTAQTLRAYVKENTLPFTKITKDFLDGLERYCKNVRGNSVATIAINMRNLRAIYRKAMAKDQSLAARYPFGEDASKYTIKSSGKVNKALTAEQISTLWECEPQDHDQGRAKDFWFFSYFSYGMNLRDICELRHTDIHSNYLHYVRAKTRTTRKVEKINQVPITNKMAGIMARLKVSDSKYLFGIIQQGDTPAQARKRIGLLNAYVIKHFRKFAFYAGLESNLAKQLGTYHTRHSFATIAYKKTLDIDLISGILHDGNIKTTQNYLDSFSKETFTDLSRDLDL